MYHTTTLEQRVLSLRNFSTGVATILLLLLLLAGAPATALSPFKPVAVCGTPPWYVGRKFSVCPDHSPICCYWTHGTDVIGCCPSGYICDLPRAACVPENVSHGTYGRCVEHSPVAYPVQTDADGVVLIYTLTGLSTIVLLLFSIKLTRRLYSRYASYANGRAAGRRRRRMLTSIIAASSEGGEARRSRSRSRGNESLGGTSAELSTLAASSAEPSIDGDDGQEPSSTAGDALLGVPGRDDAPMVGSRECAPESINGSGSDEDVEDDAPLCIVCLEHAVNCVLQPCGHACLCTPCVAQLERCPLCRKPVCNVLPIRRVDS